MADGEITVEAATGGVKRVDNETVERSGNTFFRQRVSVHDHRDYSWEFGEVASVASGSFVEIVSFTASTAGTVTGVNCDMASILAANYRFRVRFTPSGGSAETVVQEVLSTQDNSFMPLTFDFADGDKIAVELRHGEAADQDCTATIMHRVP